MDYPKVPEVLQRTAQLLEEIDKNVMVWLRDGRTLIGYLRSVDQYGNLVLQEAIERIHVGQKFGDIPRGIFVIRGDNVLLLGEVYVEKDELPLTEVSVEEILLAQKREQEEKEEKERRIAWALLERGSPLHIQGCYRKDQYTDEI